MTTSSFLPLILCLLCASGSLAGKVVNLPDYNGPPLSMYTGYIVVNQAHQRALFYWLIEAENNPTTAPLVVWFNGGPGCSSLGGLFTEHGPLRPDMDGGLQYNDLGWTQIANMLYVEMPAGVGFSYSNTSSDYNTDDFKTAADNYQFMQLFLKQFPQYVGRDLWITGESYAGVYIPTLTNLILSNSNSPLFKQLQGLMLGNPVISCASADYNAIQFNLFYYHGLVSYQVFANWTQNNCNSHGSSTDCNYIFNIAVAEIGVIFQQKKRQEPSDQPSLDPDDLYQDFCTGNGTLEFAQDMGWPLGCNPVGNRVQTYLNRQDVQQAIGVPPTTWVDCTGALNYTISGKSMIPYYKSFFATKPSLSVLVYSGDVDIFTVPFGYTQACLYELQDSLQVPWQPWFVNGATAGYVETYQHYTYATIKGGGHETPEYQPLTSLNLFQRFLTSQNLTDPHPSPRQFNRILSESDMLKMHEVMG